MCVLVIPFDARHFWDEVLGNWPKPGMPQLKLLASDHYICGKLDAAFQPVFVTTQWEPNENASRGLCNNPVEFLLQINWCPVYTMS